MEAIQKQNVSVIICMYTEARWQEILNAVSSLRLQRVQPQEIIVVVDHNPTLFQRVMNEFVDVIVVENKGPRGLSGARNSGLAVASSELIAFLDDDATAEPDWLAYLLRCCEDSDVLGAGGMVEPHWIGARPAWLPTEFYWVIGCSYQLSMDHPIEVRNPYGGCTCIRREVFTTVGGFRNGIGRIGARPLGGEETELAIRAKQRWPQRKFLYEPRAMIKHCVPPQRATWRYFFARCYAEGLSKAVISRYVGTKDALAAERRYTMKSLPQGIGRNVLQGLLHRDLSGFLRAGAIIAGLLVTASGYFSGRVSQRLELDLEGEDIPRIDSPLSTSGVR
ncbi:MAG TPA: glycosyltransferase [Dictyobacter sp.]|jgi:glycosyltransferase involved in cell wall biosynthesis|nr:glycosyltransferase [Dictyobacter sp.]